MKKLPTMLVLLAALVSNRAAWAQDEEFYLDPLGEVVVDMQVAGGRLAKLLTDKSTQRKQEDAVAKLDALIELLERRRRQSAGAGGANPDEPLDDERIVSGPGGSGPLHAPRRNGAMWGELPPHKRQEILQSMTEGFPAHYRPILERYYRRLADESPAGEATDDAAMESNTAPADEPAAAKSEPSPTNPTE